MAVYNRVLCPDCKKEHNVYDERLRLLPCVGCGKTIKVNAAKANYYIDYYVEGRRKREGIGSSRTLAETVLAKRKVEVAEGKYLDKKKDKRIKFEIFAEEYFELHSKVNNRSWKQTDKNNINCLKKFFSGHCLHEITPRLLEEFKAKRKKEEVSPARINRLLATLKCMFSKAKQWRRFSGENPVKQIKLFKENNERTRFLEKEEVVKFLAACNETLKPIAMMALNTGMRLGEILGLRWSDIDLKRELIYLYNTKNGEKREIPINKHAKNVLMNIPRHPTSEYVFHTTTGNQRKSIETSFFTAIENSGINNFRFHDLRHTFASHLVMSGVDLNTVRELLGHKSMKMTLRYAHSSPDHKKAAVDILSKRIDTFWTPDVVPKKKSESNSNVNLSVAAV
jgi:integrase